MQRSLLRRQQWILSLAAPWLLGSAIYQAMLAAIRATRDHIHTETHIRDDDVGGRFADALIARQRQGVQVNLMRDSVGSMGTPRAFFQGLTASRICSCICICILEFNPTNPAKARKQWALNQRDQRKLLIVDGRVAFLGGINFSRVNRTA